jgi:Mce-associated membrane protein
VVLVALAVALVSLATATFALLLPPHDGAADQVRESALQAARARTVALTSYDHRTLNADAAVVLETATGEFEREYRRTLEQLRGTFERTQAVAEAEVVAVGLESVQLDGEAERAVAVVAVDQVISTTGAPARTERNRLRMVLVRPEDTWLVERVERL